MKTIDPNLEDAILNNSSVSMILEAIIDRSRTYFSELYSDNPYDGGDYSIPTDDPVGQCMIYSAYMDKIYTFVVDKTTGVIYGMVAGSATKNSLGISANVDTKPSVMDSGNGTAVIYYWSNGLYKATINLTTLSASGASEIVIDGPAESEYWTIIAGSPTIIGDDRVILCYKTSKGGIGVLYKDGSQWQHWTQRFMSPNALSETAWTIHTTAIAFQGKIYVYSTDMATGEVRSVELTAHKHSWSDIFVAIPADLSRFCVTNAIVANDYVHLAGQFHRTEDHEDAQRYSLILRSSDGKTFSWDRFTLLTELGYQFHIAADNTPRKIYASDRNSVGIADMSYFFTNEPSYRVRLDETNSSVISFSTSEEQASLSLSCSDESMIDNETVRRGNRVQVSLGYRDFTKVKYATYIVDKVNAGWKDGKRSLSLQLVSQGIWKANQIAFPFYAEILSKTSLYDNCDAQDKMYVVQCDSGERLSFLSIDFWNCEKWNGDGAVTGGTEFLWCAPPQATYRGTKTTGYAFTGTLKGRTLKLNNHPLMAEYPKVTGDMTVEFYGWETGLTSGRANSTWTLYAVTAPEDDLEDKTVVQGTCTSTYQKFPKDNFGGGGSVGSAPGSYPIKFTFSGLNVNDKLLYFGVTAYNNTSGSSYMVLERIEVHSGLDFKITAMTSSTAWSLEKLSGEDRKYLVMPDTGLQNIMFTTKPYSAFNFSISAEFGYEAGDAPLSAGTTAWGVLGLAKDGSDYIIARYKRQNSKLELCLIRGGKTTVLESVTLSSVYEIMLDHRNGMFGVWTKTTDTWSKVLTHVYDEITSGVLSTSETGIMHTGIYATVFPPGFIAAAFSQPYSNGVCMTTDQTKDVIADGFPNSGHFVVDGKKYSYGRKTTNLTSSSMRYGPYQLRQVTDIGVWTEGGVTFSGIGCEIALYKPTNNELAAKNLLLGQSNHHNWLISMSDWSVTHSTAGSPDYLRNRSKHFSPSALHESSYGASISDKCYIGHGLLNIGLDEDKPFMHANGSLVTLYCTDKIWLKKVVATQIDHDATVEDMVAYLCRTASVKAEFPGNYTLDSLSIGATKSPLVPSTKEVFPGGADIRFTIDSMVNGDYVRIAPANLVLTETLEKLEFGFGYESNKLVAYITPSGTSPSEKIVTNIATRGTHDFRLLVHGDFVSMYADDKTMATFALGEENLEWDDDNSLILEVYANRTRSIENIKVSELFDWREAIYVESELSVSSAIGSVIQERPVEINQTEDGNLVFSYRFERDQITYTTGQSHRILREHDRIDQNSSNAGSDALVYYADVTFVSNSSYARNDGFNTRVFRLSNLDTGAKLAARLLLEKAYEYQRMHSFTMRPDLRIEVGDIIDFTYISSGTNIERQVVGIVDTLNIDIREGTYNMRISARMKEV